MNSFYSKEELEKIGLGSVGENVLISRKCSIYNPERINIGNNVRIDDFCILSGRIELKNNIHISAYTAMYGGNTGIEFNDFSGASPRVIIFAESDDFNGGGIANVMAPPEYRKIETGKVYLGKYAQLGAGTIVLPGSVVYEGACTGSMTLVNRNLEEWMVYVGAPCRVLHRRKKKFLC